MTDDLTMDDTTRQRREATIHAAAYALLAQHGYGGTSMLRIARAAQASNETLYRWYGDKDGLFTAMARENAADTRRLLENALECHDDPWEALVAVAPTFLRMILGDRAILLNRAAAADPTGALGAAIQNHLDNLRNHIAGTLQDDGIANADIFAGDFIFIMQSRVAHHHAADIDGFHHRAGCERTGATHLDFNIEQLRYRLFGGEFPRHCPARRAADKTKPPLPINPVKLIDNPINIISECGTAHADFGLEVLSRVFALQVPRQRVHREAPAA